MPANQPQPTATSAALRGYPPGQPPPQTTGAAPLRGRIENYKTHLENWMHYEDYLTRHQVVETGVQQVQDANAVSGNSLRDERDKSSQVGSKRQRRIDKFFTSVPQEEAQNNFENSLLEFLADNGLAFSFIERMSTLRVLEDARKMPVLELPSRMQLSKGILDRNDLECLKLYVDALME
ncbi:hypothetical protein PR003_g26822 [Phytophthora rubi]|uniref:Uncharacterized protein n=1 Tax=Phytophthora rubi TaxID=129364 RepID=A0A6A3IPR3_9STRA|nr:hypothetical protein PR002_g24275 [Phytophthora rubi]KAE8981523.1 hypothetical protein PR001_g23978 [Phytophthora rubi]KAE9284561.1 hypothetical protein PR003_g26822 [Phytophthora rubi]